MTATARRPRAWLSWSSGKDGAVALTALRDSGDVEVCGLLTVVRASDGRVPMHSVRSELLEAQADALRLPLHRVPIPTPCPDEEYARRMATALGAAAAAGVTHMAFGDLALADVREYREARLVGTGITPVFPLWGRDTALLAREVVAGGVRAVVTCVDTRVLPASFAGRDFDARLLGDLPEGVDPCGENGELHTFVVDGPGFAAPVDVRVGRTWESDGFAYADLLPRRP